jgi:hypothetical protein
MLVRMRDRGGVFVSSAYAPSGHGGAGGGPVIYEKRGCVTLVVRIHAILIPTIPLAASSVSLLPLTSRSITLRVCYRSLDSPSPLVVEARQLTLASDTSLSLSLSLSEALFA